MASKLDECAGGALRLKGVSDGGVKKRYDSSVYRNTKILISVSLGKRKRRRRKWWKR